MVRKKEKHQSNMKNKRSNKKIAREKIIEFINSMRFRTYIGELSCALNIDYDLCESIIEDLIREGILKNED